MLSLCNLGKAIINAKFSLLLGISFFVATTAMAQTCRPLLATDSFTSKISTERIGEAMRAERALPTAAFSIRAQEAFDYSVGKNGAVNPYLSLDHPRWWGKYINVNFIEDRYAKPEERADIQGDAVPQLVLTKDYLDQHAQKLIKSLKQESVSGSFQEVGGWIIYTDKHVYMSEIFGERHDERYGDLGQRLMAEHFESTYAKVLAQEGMNPVITDVEFYHTHASPGEAFSPGDYSTQKQYFRKRIKKILSPDGVYAAYAIPVQGEVLFRHAIQQSEKNVW